MDCCDKVTGEKTDPIMTTVNVPDVAVAPTEVLYVPFSVGNKPENWIRSFTVQWDDVETVD